MSIRELGFTPEVIRANVPCDPAHLRFSQQSISSFFSNGYSLQGVLQQLQIGTCVLKDFPNIQVVKRDGMWYSLDNRRLWVFKKFGKHITVDIIQDDIRFNPRFTTTTRGVNIHLRTFTPLPQDEIERHLDLKRKVLFWSINDIKNDDLYKGKLPVIAQQFDSLEHYYQSLSMHLPEEVRAKINSGIGKIDDVPYAEIEISKYTRYSQELLEIEATVRKFIPEDLDLRRANYILLISQRYQVISTGITLHVFSEDGSSFKDFPTVKFLTRYSLDYEFSCKQTMLVHVCANITTDLRVASVLRNAKQSPFFPQLLSPREVAYNHDPDPGSLPLALFQFIRSRFNPAQQQAIMTITARINHGNQMGKGVMLLQGPPGTGKTATILGSLSILVARKVRTLVCSASNYAVDDICRKIVKKGLVGVDGEVVNPFIVLVGTKENLDLTGGLEEIFLDNLVKKMKEIKGKLVGIIFKIRTFFDPSTEANQTIDMLSVVNYVKSNISRWEQECSSWISESKRWFLPSIFSNCKSTIDMIATLLFDIRTKLLPLVAADRASALRLVFYLQNGLPMAFPSGEAIKIFVQQWREVLSMARLLQEFLTQEFVDMEAKIVHEASVVFCTVSTCGSLAMRSAHFPVGIIDEACQCIESESLLTLNLISHRCVLIGDPQQLPSTVISFASKRLNYGRSMMTRMMECNHPVLLLNMQYRMHPIISSFPNKQFYGGTIKDGEPVLQKSHGGRWHEHPLFPVYAFFNITGTEQRDPVSQSIYNVHEINAVCHLISNLLREFPDTQHTQISIITPYREQLKRIEKQLAVIFPAKKFSLGTIDSFQGTENDIIILSTVRSNLSNELGFVNDYQRLNVAITRARYSLWIVGNKETLQKSTIWNPLIQDAEAKKHIQLKETHNISVTAAVDVESAISKVGSASIKRSHLFESSLWQVTLSNKACNAIRAIIKQGGDVKPLFNAMLKLAKGFRPSKATTSFATDSVSDLICEYRFNNGMIFLWTVDIDRYIGAQILKVWEVLPNPDKINDIVQRIDLSLRSYSDAYINLCRMQIFSDNLVLPVVFESKLLNSVATLASRTPAQAEVTSTTQLETSSVEESFLLMKFFPLSDHLAKMLAVGKTIEVPFNLSSEETELVKMPMSSLFILGRSGTGKTTVLIFRMFGIQQAYMNLVYADTVLSLPSPEDDKSEPKKGIKQLFVTASPTLCVSIHGYFTKLCNAPTMDPDEAPVANDLLDEYEEEAIIEAATPDTLSSVRDADCTLIVPESKLLDMVDKSSSRPFFGEKRNAWHAEGGRLGKRPSNSANPLRKEVDYVRFSEVYFKHFDQRLSSEVDAAMTFLQIMSFIKGSAEAMATQNGHLSAETYLSLPLKKCPLYTTKRAIIYKMYEKYEQLKSELKDYDQCDYVFHIIQQLKSGRNTELPKLDYIYVDEVQDLTQAQLLLFKYLCPNLKGFVFAGDTAQTIARGVGFRFEDIRSLFYLEFLNASETPPNLHCLTQNFRTHSGVCNLASSVIDPIMHFFPESIDKLEKETALVEGDLPIFLAIPHFKESFFKMCGETPSVKVNPAMKLEFGAEQAIIVRDQETKRKLETELKNALVLTVFESKGLEFKSVLLFNFWRDSPAKKVWRVIYKYMRDKNIGTSQQYPEFSKERFLALCSELKQLYVCITRAKQELIIFDEEEMTYQPMIDYWTALGRIKVVSSNADPMLFIAKLAHKSDPETWMNEGKKFFRSRNYDLALRCFINSGQSAVYLVEWTKAALLRSEGEDSLKMDKFTTAKQKFIEAAEKFERVQELRPDDRKFSDFAAATYIKAEEWETAGHIYMKEREFKKAGDSFIVPKKYSLAASAYAQCNMLREALAACIAGLLYPQGEEIVLHATAIPDDYSQDIYKFWRSGALHYHSAKDTQRMLAFVDHFAPVSEQRRFLIRYGYVNELVQVELAEGNYTKAAEIYYSNGKFTEAANAHKKAQDPVKAAECLVQHVLHQDAQKSSVQFNINAKEFVPSTRANSYGTSAHSNTTNQPKPSSDTTMKILLEAQGLVEEHKSTRVAFDVNKILAIRHFQQSKAPTGLEALLHVANERNLMAAELDILLRIIPVHIVDQQYPFDSLFAEGKRMRKLCMTLLDGLNASPSKPCSEEASELIKDFFQVSDHPNPGMKTILRLDWLPRIEHQKSVAKPYQFEIREEIFVQQATNYLGRQLAACMIGVVDRKAQECAKVAFSYGKIDMVISAITLGQEVLNIFGMVHLRFNETLKDLQGQFDEMLTKMLLDFSLLYFPVRRTTQFSSYVDNFYMLTEAPRQRIESLCIRLLTSPTRDIDGLGIVLLAEVGNNLKLWIHFFQEQKFLVRYLTNSYLGSRSRNGVNYLRHIMQTSRMKNVGLPLSQAVWMLENLTVFSLAGYTNFHCLILPKTLIVDCMYEKELLLTECLSKKVSNGDMWYLKDIWDILNGLLRGGFYGWIETFNFEDPVRSYLVERLLQLAFLIRINHLDFAYDLSELLQDFKKKFTTYRVSLSKRWTEVIDAHIKEPHELSNCSFFVDMMHSSGETYCLIKRYNTRNTRGWARFIPTLLVVAEENKSLSFKDARNIGKTNFKQILVPTEPPSVEPRASEDEKEQEDNIETAPAIDSKANERKDNEINQLAKEIAMKWLARARARLYNASPLEKYQKAAKTLLSQLPNNVPAYIDFYCTEVCMLREKLIAGYTKLSLKLSDLKSQNLSGTEVNKTIDEGLDAVEDTQSVLERLDIKNVAHNKFDFVWLQKVTNEGKQRNGRMKAYISSIETMLAGKS